MAQAILLTGHERRRRWSPDQRLEILEAAFAPGANLTEVARRFDVSTGLLYTRRRQALTVKDEPAFVPATVMDSRAVPLVGRRPSVLNLPTARR